MSYSLVKSFGSDGEQACFSAGGVYTPETDCCNCETGMFLDLENDRCVSSCPITYENRVGNCGAYRVCVAKTGQVQVPQQPSKTGAAGALAVLAAVGIGLVVLLG